MHTYIMICFLHYFHTNNKQAKLEEGKPPEQAKLEEEKPPKKVLMPCAPRHWEQQGVPKAAKKGPRARSWKEEKGKGQSPASAVGGVDGDDHGPYFSAGKMGKLIAARRGFVSSPARAGIADADAHAHATIDKCAFIHFPVLYGEESVKVKTILRLKSQFFETYC
jgi:hypothetical protein